MRPRLISFKLCPFVQRVAIALECKHVDYDIDYVDLADPPQWFLALSPLKKVPLLQLGDEVLFESAAILEYVDEAWSPRLHPGDLVVRARNRAWMELGNDCMWDVLDLTTTETETGFAQVVEGLSAKLDRIEPATAAAPFFNGRAPALIDTSFAPLLQRLRFLDALQPGVLDTVRHPRIRAWMDALLALDAVRRSHVPELRELYHDLIWRRQGYMAGFLDASRRGPPPEKSRY